MSPVLQISALALLGTTALRLVASGEYLRFVKPSLAPWLLLTGVALVALGAAVTWYLWRAADDASSHAHGGPRIGLLLLLPVAVVYVVAPPPLGSYAAERTAAREPTQVAAPSTVLPLPEPDADGYRATSLDEYTARPFWNIEPSYEGEPVRLTGFVTPRAEGGWYLTRIQIACCAADGFPIKVFVRDTGPVPPRDSWVRVDGRGLATVSPEYEEDDALGEVLAERVVPIEEPASPYEDQPGL
ncbi:MAG TPA: TIGR03943 family protein [Mycobacteriales bacterium]|nr:TIGR03943 family protein [Mycobacteriales bacterium]